MTVVVAFVSRKGGVGKSTLARALAALAARNGLTVALADLDRSQRTITRWQRLRESERVEPALTVRSYGNVDSAVASETDADLLVIDAPSHLPQLTAEIASVAHFVVQPVGSSFDDLQPAVELFYELSSLGVPRSRLLVALSRMLVPADELAARAYMEVAEFNLLPGAVVERPRYREAHSRGLSLIESPGEDLNGSAGIVLGALLARVLHKHRLLHRAPTTDADADAGASFTLRPDHTPPSLDKAIG